MPKFKKKPVVIEAVLWDSTDKAHRAICAWGKEAAAQVSCFHPDEGLRIHTLEGIMTAQNGDWVIKGVKGELYPCKPDIFYATYEPAEE